MIFHVVFVALKAATTSGYIGFVDADRNPASGLFREVDGVELGDLGVDTLQDLCWISEKEYCLPHFQNDQPPGSCKLMN